MDKYQDLFHQSQNSWGVGMNNNNNSVTDTPGSGGVVQHQFQSSEENKGKKNKKTRPSAKKRRRLKQKRKSDSHASSDISRTLTTEKQGCENTHRENMDVTMTLGQCVECNMEDEFVVISDISLNKFVMSPDMSSDSDSDDTDGGFVDMDAAAALWDSFTIGNPYDPLSFQFTCTISTNTTTLFSDVEIGTSSRIHDANRKWNESYQEVDFDINNVVDIQDRKVHFPVRDTDLAEVHHLTEWPEACTDARRGCWEEYARDRQRFGRRIQRVEELIGFCLTQAHRNVVYQTRFVEYLR
ncbi:hypothetical protein LSAT2_013952 [Lamellibrachia satsuma]|nr:hypothetical protein LSAT2_013952 [Lamellibrachia satsuma]